MTKEKSNKEVPKADYSGTPYHQKDVVSALIKSMRLGKVEEAFYWLQTMQAAGESWFHIAVTLTNFAWEDCLDDMAIVVADVGYRTLLATKGRNENVPFYVVERLCRATKFWETEEGRTRERLWWKVEDEIKEKGFTRPIPSWALDRHSWSAWKTKKFDERFSGTREGRLNMVAMYEQDGRLDPDGEPAL